MTSLINTKILVTRPIHQAQHLCQLIQAQGGLAVQLPAIAIVAFDNNPALEACRAQLDDLDMLIFISANAVETALPRLMADNGLPPQLYSASSHVEIFPSPLPPLPKGEVSSVHLPQREEFRVRVESQLQTMRSITIAAVGEKTARSLVHWGLSPLCSPAPFNSEALLALPQLQAVKGKKITIFRGEEGRELLAQTLRQRGATVNYVDVYQRIQPPTPDWVAHLQVDIITVTSVQILHNLFKMLADKTWLTHTPFAVMSERVRREAEHLGIQAPISVAPIASDEGIMTAILALQSQRL